VFVAGKLKGLNSFFLREDNSICAL